MHISWIRNYVFFFFFLTVKKIYEFCFRSSCFIQRFVLAPSDLGWILVGIEVIRYFTQDGFSFFLSKPEEGGTFNYILSWFEFCIKKIIVPTPPHPKVLILAYLLRLSPSHLSYPVMMYSCINKLYFAFLVSLLLWFLVFSLVSSCL